MFKLANNYLILFCAIIFTTNIVKSQEKNEFEKKEIHFNNKPQQKMAIFIVPQYILTNGMRIDLDIRQKVSKKWWILSPFYYYGNKNSFDLYGNFGYDRDYNNYNYDKLVGLGLGVSRKHFLSDESCISGFYFKYGLVYRHYDISGKSPLFVEFVGDDGLTYQQLEDTNYSIKIDNIQGNLEIGYQLETGMEKLFFDFYIGLGTCFSFHTSNLINKPEYNRGQYDYGYTGVLLITGIRIGVAL